MYPEIVRTRLHIAVGAALTAGCLAPTESEPEAFAAEPERFALVAAEAVAPRATAESPKFRLSAFFVESDGVSRGSVLRALDAWVPPLTDGCSAVFPGDTSPGARVEFLSAGRVGLSGNGDSGSVLPSLFSSGSRMSGFAYPHADGPVFAAGEIYTVWATGDSVEPFAQTFEAPGYIQLVSVDGRELGSAAEVPITSESFSAELFSDAETVYVSLAPIEDVGRGSIECRFESIQEIEFDLSEVDAILGHASSLRLTVRTASDAPLPTSVGADGAALVMFSDRVVLRRD